VNVADLTKAIRQYRHNNSDEFVIAYDKVETERIITELNLKLGMMKISLEHKVTLLNSCEIALEHEQFPQK
jgi:hypothetical protein